MILTTRLRLTPNPAAAGRLAFALALVLALHLSLLLGIQWERPPAAPSVPRLTLVVLQPPAPLPASPEPIGPPVPLGLSPPASAAVPAVPAPVPVPPPGDPVLPQPPSYPLPIALTAPTSTAGNTVAKPAQPVKPAKPALSVAASPPGARLVPPKPTPRPTARPRASSRSAVEKLTQPTTPIKPNPVPPPVRTRRERPPAPSVVTQSAQPALEPTGTEEDTQAAVPARRTRADGGGERRERRAAGRLDSAALLAQVGGLTTAAAPKAHRAAGEMRVTLADGGSLAGFYAADWARKVTRVGETHFPAAARSLTASVGPVLEVAIGANGSLREVRIVRSSGQAALDQAARGIVQRAAPYPPFAPALRQQATVLRIIAPWRFDPGGGVRVR